MCINNLTQTQSEDFATAYPPIPHVEEYANDHRTKMKYADKYGNGWSQYLYRDLWREYLETVDRKQLECDSDDEEVDENA